MTETNEAPKLPPEKLNPLLDALADFANVSERLGVNERRLGAMALCNNPVVLGRTLNALHTQRGYTPGEAAQRMALIRATLETIGVSLEDVAIVDHYAAATAKLADPAAVAGGAVVPESIAGEVTRLLEGETPALVGRLEIPFPAVPTVKVKHPAPWSYDHRTQKMLDANGDTVGEFVDDAVGLLVERAVGTEQAAHANRWRIVIGNGGGGVAAGRTSAVFLDGKRLQQVCGVTLLAEVDDVVRLQIELYPTELEVVSSGDPVLDGLYCGKHHAHFSSSTPCEACFQARVDAVEATKPWWCPEGCELPQQPPLDAISAGCPRCGGDLERVKEPAEDDGGVGLAGDPLTGIERSDPHLMRNARADSVGGFTPPTAPAEPTIARFQVDREPSEDEQRGRDLARAHMASSTPPPKPSKE